MAIQITNNTLLKPSYSVPHPLLNSLVPLTIFDRAAFDLHVPSLYVFQAPMPPNSSLKEGLSKVLAYFPHFAGRMTIDADSHRPCFFLNNAGVRIIETLVSAALTEKLPLDATSKLADLHPPISEPIDELLQVQLNRYTCGGLVIGVTSHHRVCDGQSMNQFFVAWAEMVRGSNPKISPYLNRAATTIPRNPPKVEFNHREIEFKQNSNPTDSNWNITSFVDLVVPFSAEFISILKSEVPNRCSTFECLLGHLWRKITVARGLKENEFTQVRVAVNGRARLRPAVPMEFFGNLVLWAYPGTQAGKLAGTSLAHAVRVIHDSVAEIDNRYFKSFIDFGNEYDDIASQEQLEIVASAAETGKGLYPNLEVDSWLRFNFHELDFGNGGPCAFHVPNLPVEGLMIFVPSSKEKGGVDVVLALGKDHAEMFKKICYSLD